MCPKFSSFNTCLCQLSSTVFYTSIVCSFIPRLHSKLRGDLCVYEAVKRTASNNWLAKTFLLICELLFIFSSANFAVFVQSRCDNPMNLPLGCVGGPLFHLLEVPAQYYWSQEKAYRWGEWENSVVPTLTIFYAPFLFTFPHSSPSQMPDEIVYCLAFQGCIELQNWGRQQPRKEGNQSCICDLFNPLCIVVPIYLQSFHLL